MSTFFYTCKRSFVIKITLFFQFILFEKKLKYKNKNPLSFECFSNFQHGTHKITTTDHQLSWIFRNDRLWCFFFAWFGLFLLFKLRNQVHKKICFVKCKHFLSKEFPFKSSFSANINLQDHNLKATLFVCFVMILCLMCCN